jgi:uncharacterized protein YndB with AHSA1/START domain
MIDVTTQINAVSRAVGTRVLDAGEARTVTISQNYDSEIDDVWDACTNPERIPRWFLPVTGELREGGRYQLEGNAGGIVQRCDPPRSFAATWEYGDALNWIELRLTETESGGTRFELEHIIPIGNEIWAEFGPGAVGLGWELGLLGLALHLATGAAVDRQPVEAWIASADGKRFMTMSGERWGEADIAGGADEFVACAAAERTIAAYAGDPPTEA